MQWPDIMLQRMAEEREREALAGASPAELRSCRRRAPLLRGWRRTMWAVGCSLEGLGRRVEEIAVAGGHA